MQVQKQKVPEDILKQLDLFEVAKKNREKRKALRFLIVEDQAFTRNLLKQVLKLHKNAMIDTAGCSKEGLELYLKYAPDMVFVDIGLPDDSGHVLTRLIRQADEEAHIVIVTASPSEQDVETAKENGVSGFVVKPFSRQRIAQTIDKYLAAKPGVVHV